jgi:magnesium chelatase family protein
MTAKNPIYCNAQMTPKLVREYCQLDVAGDKMLSFAMDKMGLSARAYDRILKVARTIADLDDSPTIQVTHITEAIGYRSLDREDWIG